MDKENAAGLTTSPTDDWRDENLAVWEISILAVILAVTVMGNALVLFAIYLRRCRGRRQRLTRMHFFVMHLSIADLITGLLNVLPQLVWDITFRWVALLAVISLDELIGWWNHYNFAFQSFTNTHKTFHFAYFLRRMFSRVNITTFRLIVWCANSTSGWKKWSNQPLHFNNSHSIYLVENYLLFSDLKVDHFSVSSSSMANRWVSI